MYSHRRPTAVEPPPRLTSIALAIAALFPAGAIAQVAPMSQVVVSATRTAQSSFDLPVSIDAIGAEQIQEGQFLVNASEALARVPGIVAPNQSRFSSDQQVSSRGFGARSGFGVRGLRIYADGVPQTMPDGQGQMGTFSLGTAERIEVMRGPFSALYGNSSGGVIQIFTREGKGDPRLTASAQGGSFGTWRAGVQADGQSGALGYLADFARFETDGYRDHSAARRDHANLKLSWRPSAATKATMVVNSLDQPYNDDPQGLTRAQMEADPRQTPSTSISQNTGGSKSQSQIGLNLEHRLDEQNTLHAVGWTGVRKVLTRLSVPFNAAAVIRGSGGVSDVDREFHGVDLRWNHKAATSGGPLNFTAGANHEYMKDVRTGFENNAGALGALRRDEDNIASNFDQYLQAEWAPNSQWTLSGGLRHSRVTIENRDRYIRATGAGNPDDSGKVTYSNTSPVLGAVYHLSRTVNLYANAGKGFETPTFIELAYRSGGASGLNFDLRPAISRNLEAGLKAFVGESTRINLALFDVRSEREIVVDTNVNGRATYANAGDTKRRGLELGIDSQLDDNLRAVLAFTVLDARFKDSYRTSSGTLIASGNKLPGTPRATLYGELAWKHPASGFSTAVEARYSDKVYVSDTNVDAADGYTVVNWRGGFEQTVGRARFSEFVRVENLGDKRYVGGVLVNDGNGRYFAPAPGRNYLVGVSASLAF